MPEAFNPAAGLAQQERRPRAPRTKKPRKSRESTPAIEPEAEESALKSLGRKTIAGAARIGNVLDLPGSFVRDALSLKNPFDQFLTPTTSENRQSGRDLLTTWGVTKPNDPDKWEAADFAGFGAEILTDPLTYLTFGANAATKGGQIAAKAGLSKNLGKVAGMGVGKRAAGLRTSLGQLVEHGGDEALQSATTAAGKMGVNLSDHLDEPLRGMVGVGLPFREPMATFGKAGGMLEKTADKLGKVASPVTKPIKAVGRQLGSLFDAKVGQALRPAGRIAGRELHEARQIGTSAARATTARALESIRSSSKYSDDDMRLIAEGFEAVPDDLKGAFEPFWEDFADVIAKNRDWGLQSKELADDYIKNYWPRKLGAEIYQSRKGQQKFVSTEDESQLMRDDIFRDVDKGTVTLKRLIQASYGMKDRDEIMKLIQSPDFKNQIPDLATIADPDLARKLGVEAGEKAEGRHERLAEYLANLSDESKAVGLFSNSPFHDAQTALVGMRETGEMGKSLVEMMADDSLLDLAVKTSKNADDVVKVSEVFNKAGMTPRAMEKLAELRKVSVDDLKGLSIPSDFADDLLATMKGVSGPRAARNLVNALDSFTSVFKMGVLTWPSFHTRNFLSGQFRNFTTGDFSLSSLTDAWKIAHGGNVGSWEKYANLPWVQELLRGKNATAETVTDAIRERLYREHLVARGQGPVGAELGSTPGTLSAMMGEVPGGYGGSEGFNFATAGRKAIGRETGTNWNPLDVRGFNNRSETKFGPAAASEDIGHIIESLNRISPWLKQVAEGVDPGQAARKTVASQIDYTNRALTKFERDVATRAIPFYRFARGNTEFVARQLIDRPGGALGQTIRAQRLATSDDPGLPDHVAARSALPLNNPLAEAVLGKPAEGNTRFLTSLGLMHEDPLEMVGDNPLLEAASRLNPAFKAPLELAFGESTFQKGPSGGRDLSDLNPTIGQTAANIAGRKRPYDTRALDFLIGNSPLARISTTARTATDPRKTLADKAINLATGVRLTDVSEDARDRTLIDKVAAEMKANGGRTFSQAYYPKDEELTPEQEQLLALMKGVNRRKKSRRKAQAKK